MTADAVNDVKPSGEPSYDNVALCVGTDFQGHPITLVNRLCLNRPAAEQMADDFRICVQQQRAAERDSSLCSIQLDNQTERVEFYQMASAIAGIGLMLLLALFFWARK